VPPPSGIKGCRLPCSTSIAGVFGCNTVMADRVSTVSVGLPTAAGAGVTMSMTGAGGGVGGDCSTAAGEDAAASSDATIGLGAGSLRVSVGGTRVT
jgi:hypothetical protein